MFNKGIFTKNALKKKKKKKSRASVVKSVLEYHQIPVGNECTIPLWKLTGLTEYSFD